MALKLQERADEPKARTIARGALDPAVTASGSLARINRHWPQVDINAFVAELQEQAGAASTGDLSRSEGMLVSQAATLDAVFHQMLGWALNHSGGENANSGHFEMCMRLALKAQSQSRATIETLAAVKNPPVVYARQANFAAGHQQVNNGGEPARVREIENPPTKLLEAQHGERLDTGATTPAIGANQTLETVGARNGAAHARG
jgi:hypothetical protein